MQGKIIGYQRVSTTDQSTARQLEGVHTDRMFTDKLSGKNTDRPALQQLLDYAREGDTVKVHSLDRLARNLGDLLKLVDSLVAKGVRIEFLKEGLVFDGQDNPMSTLMLSMMGAFAQFERSLILERQREGIALAKAAGKYKGRAPSLTLEQAAEAKAAIATGIPIARVARDYGVSRSTIYDSLRRLA